MFLARIQLTNKYFLCFISNQARFRKMQTNCEASIKPRENPAVMKIDTPEFRSLFNAELTTLAALFDKHNYEIRIAGGAVRDLLLNIRPHDLDFATTATPQQMKDMFVKEGVRIVNSNGERHGTITPRINDKENFEVTTLRIDTSTDGRHAEVQFTKDWLLDANRRDLTVNSMFLGFDGTVYDYFYGLEDLQKRRVAFVGDPATRIKEDYLRILRYFRFYGRISLENKNHDEKTLEAIKDNVNGLERISGERIWMELKKIATGNFAKDLLEVMSSCGILEKCGLPEKPNMTELQRLCVELEHFPPPHHAILYVISLLNTPQDVITLHKRLKLSAFERDLAVFITNNRNNDELKSLEYCKKMCFLQLAPREFVQEISKYSNRLELYQKLKEWVIPKFPIKGDILLNCGCPKKSMKSVIISLKSIFADSDYTLSSEELLEKHLPNILEEVQEESPHKKIRQ